MKYEGDDDELIVVDSPVISLEEARQRRSQWEESESARAIREADERAAATPAEPEQPAWDPDLIPDANESYGIEDDEVDRAIRSFGIVNAYVRWCGKMRPRVGNKTESIMVSCPNPEHEDKNPSAWLNSDKGVGNCALCEGFDIYDIYAWNHGFAVPEYRTTSDFATVKNAMAEDLGIEVVRAPITGQTYVIVPEEADEAPSSVSCNDAPPAEEEYATVVPFTMLEQPMLPDAGFDWRDILDSSSTFLKPWMELCSQDDLPEEFYFWLGLQAIAAAIGNNYTLADTLPVRANLMVCLVGTSGMGKSRSVRVLETLLNEAFSFDPEKGGFRTIGNTGSGEALLDEFAVEFSDPLNPGSLPVALPVNGLVKVDELATMTIRAARQGSVVKQVIMEMYDNPADYRLSSRTHGKSVASGHFLQVTSGTQPGVLQKLLSYEDALSGFINRWVFVAGTEKTPTALGASAIDPSPLVPEIKAIAALSGQVTLYQDGLDVWSDFFHRELVPLKRDPAMPVFARSDLLFKKLLVLFAADRKKKALDAQGVEQVLKLWPYIKHMYAFVNEETALSEQDKRTDLENRILKVIKDHHAQVGSWPSSGDIWRRMGDSMRKKHGREACNKALKTLIDSSEIEQFADKKATGRPCVRYAAKV